MKSIRLLAFLSIAVMFLSAAVSRHAPARLQPSWQSREEPRPQARLKPPSQTEDITIAAAADLKFAMDSLISSFSAQPGAPHITAVYGSSGNFFEQIRNGAPFDIFFSADLDYPKNLAQQNKTIGEVKQYATGQIVLWSKKIDPAKSGMSSLLDPTIIKIAIANPAHAPYGKRAEESLEFYKLYDQVKDKLVFGENISQTAEFAKTGAADIGIIALSLARSPGMSQSGGRYWLIPEQSHQPLRQGYVLLRHAENKPQAARFIAFVGSPAARAIFHYFGFGE